MFQPLIEADCCSFNNRIPLARVGVSFGPLDQWTPFRCLLDTGSTYTRLTSPGMEIMKEMDLDPAARPGSWHRPLARPWLQIWNSSVSFHFERGPTMMVDFICYLERFYQDPVGEAVAIKDESYELVLGRDLMEQTIFEYRGLESRFKLSTL